jgi:hypothetical protein
VNWVFYFGTGFNTNHFNIWLPYVELSSFNYTIWVDSDEYVIPEKMLKPIGELENLSLIIGKDAISTTETSIDGFLYLSHKKANYKNISKFKKFRHIYLGHGDSFKTDTTGSLAILRYQVALQAGYWVKSRFPRLLRRKVSKKLLAIGAPVYLGAQRNLPSEPLGNAEEMSALYAPTWEGFKATQNFSSLPAMEDLIPQANQRLNLKTVFRPHPTTGKREEKYLDFVNSIKVTSQKSSSNKAIQFSECDFLISDVSGLTAEFLFTGKPIFMPWLSSYNESGMSLSEMKKLHPFAYIWDVDNQDFCEFIRTSLETDQLERVRFSSRKKYFRNIASIEEATLIFEKALILSAESVSWRKRRREFEKFMRLNRLG